MMKKLFLVLSLTGCSTVQTLNDHINDTTYSIQNNTETVRRSTQVIRENAAQVDGSTQALIENHKALEAHK